MLRIRLNRDGELLGSTLDRSSGIREPDDEGAEAFKKAQPFPNPPRQLFGDEAEIVFPFGFCLTLRTNPQQKDAGVADHPGGRHAADVVEGG